MHEVFIGSAALAKGGLTRGSLRWNYRAIFPDIYLSKLVAPSLEQKATGVNALDVLMLAERYPRARGLPRARVALALMDGGAQSPQATRLRLILIDDGLPPPRTQIRVSDGANEAFIDMGYDEPMVGLDYDGEHHASNREQYVYDIGRAELIDSQGWIDIRVVAEHSRRFILHRAREAFARRGWTPPKLR